MKDAGYISASTSPPRPHRRGLIEALMTPKLPSLPAPSLPGLTAGASLKPARLDRLWTVQHARLPGLTAGASLKRSYLIGRTGEDWERLPGLTAGASLKRHQRHGCRRRRYDRLPGLTAGASLKPARAFAAVFSSSWPPRPHRRGLIEACVRWWSCRMPSGPPRPHRRGLIEARAGRRWSIPNCGLPGLTAGASLKPGVQAGPEAHPPGPPRPHRRGLIEAGR